jgi:hypothetical protein
MSLVSYDCTDSYASHEDPGVTGNNLSIHGMLPDYSEYVNGGYGFMCNPSAGDLAGAIAYGTYVKFVLQPDPEKGLSLDSISFKIAKSENPDYWTTSLGFALRSSIDNFGSNIGSGTGTTTLTNVTYSLTANQYQSIEDQIEFRIYFYGSNTGNPSGAMGFFDDIVINGNVVDAEFPKVIWVS